MHCVQDGLNYSVIAHRGIEHKVVQRSRGPIGIEIVFDESDALAVDDLDEFLGLLNHVTFFAEAANFFSARSVEEDVKCIGAVAQEKWCAASHHNSVSFLRNLLRDLLHHRHHAICVKDLIAKGRTAFVAASPEG